MALGLWPWIVPGLDNPYDCWFCPRDQTFGRTSSFHNMFSNCSDAEAFLKGRGSVIRSRKALQHKIDVKFDEIVWPCSVSPNSLLLEWQFGLHCSDILRQIVRGHKSRQLSPLEKLPWHLRQQIACHINCAVDIVCLGLGSKTLASQVVNCGFLPAVKNCPRDLETHMALMSRLSSWMPKHLVFCHHCLMYRPRLDFSTISVCQIETDFVCFTLCLLEVPRRRSIQALTYVC
jgi:hypothetical protein